MTEIRKAFHDELDEMTRDVVRLGGMAGEAIGAATKALLEADLAAVERVVAGDVEIDALTDAVEQHAYQLFARQQPMAGDLRTLLTTIRAIHEIERVGDYMVRIAKATRRLYPHELDPRIRGLLERMGTQAAEQLSLAVQAFAERDPAMAAALTDMDDVMDDLQKDLFQAIFAGHADDETLQRAVQFALVGRYFERAGDHAANVAERVAFMVTGQLRHHGEPS